MFDNKYKKVLSILDDKIDSTQKMFNYYIHQNNGKERSNEEIYNDIMVCGGQFSKVDKCVAKLEALCELKREIQKEMES